MIEMILECIATGSSGNCYILQADNGERLVLDAGISISRLKQAIDFDIKTLRGCLITHRHKDHARCVDELERIGAYVYMPYDIENPKTLKKIIWEVFLYHLFHWIITMEVLPYRCRRNRMPMLRIYDRA